MPFFLLGAEIVQANKVVVVGAGVGGLAAALDLAVMGADVILLESSDRCGGKLGANIVEGVAIDAGPTVFTLRPIFDDLFENAGARLDDYLTLAPVEILARHAWSEGERLDLYADPRRSADAIGDFAGARSARLYEEFCRTSKSVFEALDTSFMRRSRPNVASLMAGMDYQGIASLLRVPPFRSLWHQLGRYFPDPRLRQLFGRYATYCGGSPYASPAILMLIAHVEQRGVWAVKGGLHRLAQALESLCRNMGVTIQLNSKVTEILTQGGRAAGVRLGTGQQIDACAVVVNADPSALAEGCFGRDAARALNTYRPRERSLSAVTWTLLGRPQGFELSHHNVFFSSDYRGEFADILDRRLMPADPTVYLCAGDRGHDWSAAPDAPEKLFCLVNAPTDSSGTGLSQWEIDQCEKRMMTQLARCGLRIERHAREIVRTGPSDFARLYPSSQGALYGAAPHGWRAAFQRPTNRTKMPGLYLAGGGTHPGPGLPMATLSGRQAAAALLADRLLTTRSRTAVTCGGTSTVGATTASMP